MTGFHARSNTNGCECVSQTRIYVSSATKLLIFCCCLAVLSAEQGKIYTGTNFPVNLRVGGTLQCRNRLLSDYVWYYPNGRRVLQSNQLKRYILDVLHASVLDRRALHQNAPSGIYSCRPEDNHFAGASFIPLYAEGRGSIVLERLYIDETLSDLMANNPKLTLVVRTRGGPLTDISWKLNRVSKNYTVDVDIDRTRETPLSLSKFQVITVLYGRQLGTYTFSAKNRAMTGAVNISVNVTATPMPIGVTVIQSGHGELTVSWTPPSPSLKYNLKIMRDFGSMMTVSTNMSTYIFSNLDPSNYTISILSYTDTGTQFPSLEVEERITVYDWLVPFNLTLVSRTPTSLTIFLFRPGHPLVDEYIVTLTSEGNCLSSPESRTESTNSTSPTISNLSVSTEYSITVNAVHAEIRISSTPLNVTTLDAAPTMPPLNVTAASQSRSISLTWDENDCLGQLTGYAVEFGPLGGTTDIIVIENGTRSFTESGLTPGTNYTFRVAGVSPVGIGVYSDAITVETVEEVPGQVFNLVAQSRFFSVELTWSPPLKPNGVIINYEVTYTIDNYSAVAVNTTAISTAYNISSLPPESKASVSVRAYTKAGKGAALNIRNITVGKLIPPPLFLASLAFDEDSVINFDSERITATVHITWQEPIGPQVVVTAYSVTFRTLEGSQVFARGSLDPSVTTFNLTSRLELGMMYYATVTAFNGAGNITSRTDSVMAPQGIPDAVSNVRMTFFDHTSSTFDSSSGLLTIPVAISWRMPHLLYGTLQAYSVAVQNLNGVIVHRNANIDPSTTSVTEIVSVLPVTLYSAIINATTGGGTSSATSNIVLSPEAASSPPLNVAITRITSRNATVTWSPPTSPNGDIVSYNITVLEGMGTVTLRTTSLSVLLKALMPYTQYSVQVSAMNSVQGESSSPVTFTTGEDVPGPIPAVYITIPDNSSMFVSWETPRVPNGALTYTVSLQQTIRGSGEEIFLGNMTTTDTFVHFELTLLPYTTYTARVTPFTSAGEGEEASSFFITEQEISSDIRSLNFSFNDTHFIAAWTEPDSTNGDIRYNLTITRTGQPGSTATIVEQVEIEETMFQLPYEVEPFTEYVVSVVPVTEAGAGNTARAAIITPEKVPSAPRNFSIITIAGSFALLASWHVPEHSNGIITGYTIICNTSNTIKEFTFNSSVMLATLRGFIPLTVYECFITANTSIGEGPPSDSSITSTDFEEISLVSISEAAIYAHQGSDVLIRATVVTSGPPTLLWYYEGSLISDNNSRYTILPQDGNMYSLRVLNVDSDVLGLYEVVVTKGRSEKSDSVQLRFPVPPSSDVIPNFASINENTSTQFQCMVGGTDVNVTWLFEGALQLPNGVILEGSDLRIVSATKDHAGLYECVVRSSFGGTATSSVNLTVFYAPILTMVVRNKEEGTGTITTRNFLSVMVEDGYPAPFISCSSDGLPLPSRPIWSKSSGSLPEEVLISMLPTNYEIDLEWTRDLMYTDSGQYQCTSSNTIGTRVSILDLLVRWSPKVTSIFPNFPVTSVSFLSFSVPLGFTGTVLTCAAQGWPTPSVQWLHNGENLGDIATSELTRTPGSPFVSARIIWDDGFSESDAGEYTCVVMANNTNIISRNVSLLSNIVGQPSLLRECSVNSSQTFFKFMILDTNCLRWSQKLKEDIAENLQTELSKIATELCEECMQITTNETEILGIPTCSRETQGAAVFRGRIVTHESDRRKSIFCALQNWQRSGPFLEINGNLCLVDKTCPFESSSSRSDCLSSSSSHVSSSNIVVAIAELLALYLFVHY